MRLIQRIRDHLRGRIVPPAPKISTLQVFPGERAPARLDNRCHKLPDRRMAERRTLKWQDSRGSDHLADVSFGFDHEGVIREVFCLAASEGTDMQSLVHDACVAASLALQHGARVQNLAHSFSELREEGQAAGRPASVMGAIARLGVAVETQLQRGVGG